MFVKICGTTNLPDAELAVELGADALGFIFAPSRRRVTVEQAAEITHFLPSYVERVGVFTEPDVEAVAHAVHGAHLSAVQMHWTFDSGMVGALREAVGGEVRLWQVVGFEANAPDQERAEQAFSSTLREALSDARLSVVLLDTVKDGASGGLGQAFSWERAAPMLKSARMAASGAAQTRGEPTPRLMLAGGLRAENLRTAVSVIRPAGVDVVSGVEASPGKKSPDRLRAFFKAVRCAV